jgi:PilZ domain-containing protein
MKRLVWIDTYGVRAFGCAGCRWTYPVKEFTPEFCATELREEFCDHDCDDRRFKFEDDGNSTLPVTGDLTAWPLNSDQLLRDLCGLKGTVVAGIEAPSSPAPSNEDMAAIRRELDSVRSLLWLYMHASPVPSKDGPQIPSTTDQERRWRRYNFQVPVTLTMSDGNKKIQAHGTNLNEGGLTVHAEAELALRDELKVEFTPPFSTAAVHLSAIVKSRIGNAYGMEFVGTDGAELQEIVLLRKIVKMLEARVSYYEERETKKVLD